MCVIFREPGLGQLSSSGFPAVSLIFRDPYFHICSTFRTLLNQFSVFEIQSQQRLSAPLLHTKGLLFISYPNASVCLVYFCSPIFSLEIRSIFPSSFLLPFFSFHSFAWKLTKVEAVAAVGPEWMRMEHPRDFALVKGQA